MFKIAYGAKVAAVTFAFSATINFKFRPYHLAANKMMNIPYPNGGTTYSVLNKSFGSVLTSHSFKHNWLDDAQLF